MRTKFHIKWNKIKWCKSFKSSQVWGQVILIESKQRKK
jgi:hypothetical protein